MKEVKSDLKSPDQIVAQCDHKSLSTGQAQKRLKYKLKVKEVTDKLRPVPKGRAKLMIGNSEGNPGIYSECMTLAATVYFSPKVFQKKNFVLLL